MPIYFDERSKTFHLDAKDTSYIIQIAPCGYLAHVYYGRRLPDADMGYLLRFDTPPFTPLTNDRERLGFVDTLPFEYPCFGIGDYRESALRICAPDGSSACDLRYGSHRIFRGKPRLDGLPATFATAESDCETLEITLRDEHAALEVTLVYSVFDKLDVITRSARIRNAGSAPLTLTRALSACVEFDGDGCDFITLNGSWGRERNVQRAPLHLGKQSVDSIRGCSSHQHNPFAALCEHGADEEHGECFGFGFVYSGNFTALAEVNDQRKTRFVMGIAPDDFAWALAPGEQFTAPEVVCVHSADGLGAMSRTFHDLYRDNLIRGEWRNKRRPVLINNWEATYFDFTSEKLLDIARQASSLGIEMLVMDDGWFGKRNSDDCSLGDWQVNENKLGGGLKALVDSVNALGMKFGIWFEPEMVSPDSDLYRAHPDWAIQVNGRPLTLARNQYVLDFSRADVRDCIYAQMRAVLDSANIEYVKWDMNRTVTELGSAALPPERQRELPHRYILGVYDLLERLTADYPHLLLEGCAGGGGRFDAGMLYYAPQIWCSDDTDAVERLAIQHGTSFCYPCSAMGAHVSVCPNHHTGRSVPFRVRGIVASAGTFGYELDVTAIPQSERDEIPQQIAEFKRFEHLVREGDHYRIGDILSDPEWDAWMFVSKDRAEALFSYVQARANINRRTRSVKLRGLDPQAFYRLDGSDTVLSGAALMYAGLNMPLFRCECDGLRIHLVKVTD